MLFAMAVIKPKLLLGAAAPEGVSLSLESSGTPKSEVSMARSLSLSIEAILHRDGAAAKVSTLTGSIPPFCLFPAPKDSPDEESQPQRQAGLLWDALGTVGCSESLIVWIWLGSQMIRSLL